MRLFVVQRVRTIHDTVVLRHVTRITRAAAAWGCPFVLYWELYDNNSTEPIIPRSGATTVLYKWFAAYFAAAQAFIAFYESSHGGEHPSQTAANEWATQYFNVPDVDLLNNSCASIANAPFAWQAPGGHEQDCCYGCEVDPACGSGVYTAQACHYLRSTNPAPPPLPPAPPPLPPTPPGDPLPPSAPLHCSVGCTPAIWNTVAQGVTCGDRITWVTVHVTNGDELEACARTAASYPNFCAACGLDLPTMPPPPGLPMSPVPPVPRAHSQCDESACTGRCSFSCQTRNPTSGECVGAASDACACIDPRQTPWCGERVP